MVMAIKTTNPIALATATKSSVPAPSRARTVRCRHIHTSTAVVVLLITTTAWLCLVFSGATARCWNRLKDWEGSPHSLPWMNRRSSLNRLSFVSLPPQPQPPHLSRISYSGNVSLRGDQMSLKHVVFGIAGSSKLWNRRKEFIRLWWRPAEMRGHVWLDEQVSQLDWDDSLPPIMVSEDISHFRYTNPTGHPSGLRISRIISECFRLGLPDVRWFVLGDDDTIFNADNLLAVLSKYDSSEMVYIGSPSESHSANTYFSHSMAFGGGGITISYPLAEALSVVQDECLERYPKLYGSDDRLHACITELGVPLTRELGFHQWDIRGNAHGLLSSHPIGPFVSIHHVEAVDPFYPGLSSLDSLKLFTKAMRMDPLSFLQRSICYDHGRHLTFSVSLGYVVQVLPNVVLPRELERSEQTFSAWNRIQKRIEFDLDMRDPYRSICNKPILFFLQDLRREENATLGSYKRAQEKDGLKKRLICLTRFAPLQNVQRIEVLGYPLRKNWHLAPRRLCCKVNQTNNELLRLVVGQCEKGGFVF